MTTKNFQNLLTLEGSYSINILSNNTLHMNDGFLVPQNEHDLVSVKTKLKALLPIRNFYNNFYIYISYSLYLIFPTQFFIYLLPHNSCIIFMASCNSF